MAVSGDMGVIPVLLVIGVVAYLYLSGDLSKLFGASGQVPGQTKEAYNTGVTSVTVAGQQQANNPDTQQPLVNNPSVMYNSNGSVYLPTIPGLVNTTYGGPQPSTADLIERNTAV